LYAFINIYILFQSKPGARPLINNKQQKEHYSNKRIHSVANEFVIHLCILRQQPLQYTQAASNMQLYHTTQLQCNESSNNKRNKF